MSESCTQQAEKLYLPHIQSPADLRALPDEAIPALCEELRATLVETVSERNVSPSAIQETVTLPCLNSVTPE
jgi:hypothetical protein